MGPFVGERQLKPKDNLNRAFDREFDRQFTGVFQAQFYDSSRINQDTNLMLFGTKKRNIPVIDGLCFRGIVQRLKRLLCFSKIFFFRLHEDLCIDCIHSKVSGKQWGMTQE